MDSPADILAAARLNPVGPYLPAREEWLTGWTGPLTVRVSGVNGTRPAGGLHRAISRDGGVLYDDDPSGEPGWQHVDRSAIGAEWGTVAEVLLDTRRPEVRALLVSHGCPEWARDVPAAVWAWGSGAVITRKAEYSDAGDGLYVRAGYVLEALDGWYIPLPGGGVGWWPKSLETP